MPLVKEYLSKWDESCKIYTKSVRVFRIKSLAFIDLLFSYREKTFIFLVRFVVVQTISS